MKDFQLDASSDSAMPSREATRALLERGNSVPVYRTVLADLETPVSVYHKLRQLGDEAFLLESVERGEQVGRYSFLGVNPRGRIVVRGREVWHSIDGVSERRMLREGEDPLDLVKQAMGSVKTVKIEGLPRFIGGAVGYIGYDTVRFFERLPDTAEPGIDVPDLVFLLVDSLVIFDHVKHVLHILANAHPDTPANVDASYDKALRQIEVILAILAEPLPPLPPIAAPVGDLLTSNVAKDRFEENVRQVKDYIAAGDVFQVVLSQRFTRQTSARPLTLYRALRALNPSPYMFFFEFGGGIAPEPVCLIGASPEMMVRLEDGTAVVRPIAGTRPRGLSESEDVRLADDLLSDPKERAEHVMLVDLGRNDLGRVCKYGSVHVSRMMSVERYSHVMHIVSQVEGKIDSEIDAFALLRATFPAGTLSGAPKIRAMEIIEELEGVRRGPYGGAVGYFSYDGSMDTCITIRAMVMCGDRVYVQAGAGIVADSDPAREYEETKSKARALTVAVDLAEHGLVTLGG